MTQTFEGEKEISFERIRIRFSLDSDARNRQAQSVPRYGVLGTVNRKQAQLRLCKLGPGTVLRHTEGGERTHNVTQRTYTHIFIGGGTHPQCNPTNGHTNFL